MAIYKHKPPRTVEGGKHVIIIMDGDPKEIAALVLAVQERQELADSVAGKIAKELGRISLHDEC